MTDYPKSKREKDHDLYEELDDSFPASDPPSSSTPGTGSGAPDPDQDHDDHGGDDHDGEDGDRKDGEYRPRRSPADPSGLRPGSGGMPVRDA